MSEFLVHHEVAKVIKKHTAITGSLLADMVAGICVVQVRANLEMAKLTAAHVVDGFAELVDENGGPLSKEVILASKEELLGYVDEAIAEPFEGQPEEIFEMLQEAGIISKETTYSPQDEEI